MQTSYFAKLAKLRPGDPAARGAISIARGTPAWFKGEAYEPLMPSWELIRWVKSMPPGRAPWRIYTERYRSEVLAKLDPEAVARDLEQICHLPDGPVEPILLCWEASGLPCHRILVAEWFALELGVDVPELGVVQRRLL